MEDLAILIFVGFLGLCFGSFATALSYRLPRGLSVVTSKSKKGESLPSRSQCPHCSTTLSVLDLIPVFSWLFSAGKCRYCKAKIGLRYPLIELGTFILFIAFYLKYGLVWQTLPLILLAPVLISIVSIDFEFSIIPDELNLSIAILGFAFLGLQFIEIQNLSFWWEEEASSALISILTYFLFAYFLRLIFMWILKKDPLGFGDIKFFAAIGVWLDIMLLPAFLLISGVSGLIIGMGWKKIMKTETFPFGPALVIAFITCVLAEKQIFDFLS